MTGEFSYPEEVIRANNAANAELRARAEKAEAALENLRGAARETLRALRAERDESTLARSVVTEHSLVRLAGLAGVEWQ